MSDEILQYFSGVPLPTAAPAQDQQVAPSALTVSSALMVCTPTINMVGETRPIMTHGTTDP
jgi:hypothetical protein